MSSIAVIGKPGIDAGDSDLVPGTTFTYDFDALQTNGTPVSVTTNRQTHHVNDPDDTGETLKTIEYSDGFARLVQTRVFAEDTIYGHANSVHPFGSSGLNPDMTLTSSDAVAFVRSPADPDNVVVSGWTTYDNKGNVVEKYEPLDLPRFPGHAPPSVG